MRVLIIEDEKPAFLKLTRLLNDINPGIKVIGVLKSVEEAANWFLKKPEPDLIFMDIELEDGICFELFENTKIETPVIFTTAYDEYTLKAFKVNSVDYLLKPIDRDELKNALVKYNTHHRPIDYSGLELIIKQFQPLTKERFLVKIGEHYKPVQVSDIACFYIKERCNFIHLFSGKNYPVDHSLDKIEQLVDPGQFFRTGRNFIINLSAIKDIIAYSSHRLKIILTSWTEDDDIIVSRERVAAFKQWLDK